MRFAAEAQIGAGEIRKVKTRSIASNRRAGSMGFEM
jgi:hypothetical protein